MLADVLTSAASWNSEQPLLTYTVPAELQEQLHPGQLVAIPYGERLVEGIVWSIQSVQADDLRPISAILDIESALLPHQRALAEWISEYYVTPLAHIAVIMLPPGLMQRSQVVLQLAKSEQSEHEQSRHDELPVRAGNERWRIVAGCYHSTSSLHE